MKVVYVLNIFPKISETFILNEMVEMQKKGVALEVYAYKDQKETVRHPKVERITEVRYFYKVGPLGWLYAHFYWMVKNFPGYLRAWSLVLTHGKLIRKNFFVQLYDTVLLDRRKPEHVHAHYSDDASDLAMVYSRLSGVPFTFTTHMHDIYDTPAPNFAIKSRLAKKHITISEFNRQYLIRTFGIAPEHISVIHCGIDFEKVPTHEAIGADKDIFCSARLHRDKGLDILIRACAKLKEEGMTVTCRIAGEGEERPALETLIRQVGLEKSFLLLGNQTQTQVFDYLRRSRIKVLPSRSEGIPVSLMEAMAIGTPVIATAIRGIPELIEDGHSGYLVLPDDVEALAGRIRQLMTDDALCQRFAGAARQKVRRDFNLSTEADKLLALWKAA